MKRIIKSAKPLLKKLKIYSNNKNSLKIREFNFSILRRSRRDGRAISCVGEKKWQKDSPLRGISIPPYVIGF